MTDHSDRDDVSHDAMNNLNSRVARLEEGVSAIRGDVHSLNDAFRDLSERLSRRTETNWGVYFSGLGVLLLFVVTMGGGALAPLYVMIQGNTKMTASNKREIQDAMANAVSRVDKIDLDIRRHQHKPGHQTAITQNIEASKRMDDANDRLEKQVTLLDQKLQREMELADHTQTQRIEQLDRTLFRELRAIRDQINSMTHGWTIKPRQEYNGRGSRFLDPTNRIGG